MEDNSYLDHILSFYNRYARYYDLLEFVRSGTRRKVVTLSGWKPGERVLDICTGTGDLALAFARRGAEVVGIDISVGMLKCAYAKPVSPKPAWLEMDATNLCFRDGAFDISTISLALHHMLEPTQRSVLAEIDRVTRGRIVIVEPHTPTNPRLWPLWAMLFSRLDESEHLREWVRQDFAGTCRAIGLKIEAVQVMTFGMHRITVCTPNGGVSRLR